MQRFAHIRRRRAGSGAVRPVGEGASRLAAVYRAQGFRVDQLPPGEDATGEAPDAALQLHRGRDSVLVHAYCSGHAPVSQQAVQYLAQALFDAGATSAVLIGRVGFTAGARNAAVRLGQIGLLEGAALQAMTGGSEAEAWAALSAPADMPSAARITRDGTLPAWPVRAAIGMGGMAMAVTLLFASVPSLRGDVQQMLLPTASAATAQPQAEAWLAPAASRSGELALRVSSQTQPRARDDADATGEAKAAHLAQDQAPRL